MGSWVDLGGVRWFHGGGLQEQVKEPVLGALMLIRYLLMQVHWIQSYGSHM